MKKDNRVFIMHSIWYKPGGASKYREYLQKALPMVEAADGRKLRSLEPERALVGDFDADLVFFIEFPSWELYKKFVTSAEHRKLAYLRESAVDKMVIVKCARPRPMGR